MVVVKIMGGMGNQMFQYATARRLALFNNIELKLDIGSFDKIDKYTTPRVFALDKFNITGSIATKKETRQFTKYRKNHTRIFGFFYNRLIADESIYIRERSYNFNKEILDLKDGVYLDGYWQSEKYFKDIEEIIRTEFTLKYSPEITYVKAYKEISSYNSVSLHIRRGDYASNPELVKNYGAFNPEYYKKAISAVSERVGHPHFYIFSDDIEWVKANLPIDKPYTYVSNKNLRDCEELMLMSQCKHNIIANSSFSWWGAWLNSNKEKIVIAPQKWFADASWIPGDLIPDSWIRI